mmetsp:Transcript_50535/g.153740  ORF Transcript_50535/g.153740 Transcript_50535/m.153740 type:complete len:345 (-) Transcript_50535:24-1058(-)
MSRASFADDAWRRRGSDASAASDRAPGGSGGEEDLQTRIKELKEKLAELEQQNDELKDAGADQATVAEAAGSRCTKTTTVARWAQISVDFDDDDDEADDEKVRKHDMCCRQWKMAIRSVVSQNKLNRMRVALLKDRDALLNELDAVDKEGRELSRVRESISQEAKKVEERARKQEAKAAAKHQDKMSGLTMKYQILQARLHGSTGDGDVSRPRLGSSLSDELQEYFATDSDSGQGPDVTPELEARAKELAEDLVQAQEMAQDLRRQIEEKEGELVLAKKTADDLAAGEKKGSSWWQWLFCSRRHAMEAPLLPDGGEGGCGAPAEAGKTEAEETEADKGCTGATA